MCAWPTARSKPRARAEAEEWFKRSLRENRNNVNAYAFLGRIYLERNEYATASDYIEQAVVRRPDKMQFRAMLVDALLQQGRCEEASIHMVWLGEKIPERLDYWQEQGDILLRHRCGEVLRRAYAPVLRYVEGYLEDHPHDEVYAINAGIFLGKLGRLEESLAWFRHALELHPDSPAALFNTGTTLGRLGREEEARSTLEHFLRLHPENPLAANARSLLGRNPEPKPVP